MSRKLAFLLLAWLVASPHVWASKNDDKPVGRGHHAKLASAKQCEAAILEFARKEPKIGWVISDEDLDRVVAVKQARITYAAVYECPNCGMPNPHLGKSGEVMECSFCKKPFDASTPVHKLTDQNGKEIILLSSINFDDDGKYKKIEAPWICGKCHRTNLDSADKCVECGASKEEGTRKVVEFGEGRVLVDAPNTHDGVVLDTPEDAERAKQHRRKLDGGGGSGGGGGVSDDETTSGGGPGAASADTGSRSLNKKTLALVAAGLIGAATVTYALRPAPPPDLEPTKAVSAEVEQSHWVRNIVILHKQDGMWVPFKTLTAAGDSSTEPVLPEVPEEFRDPKQYQLRSQDSYQIQINHGKKTYLWNAAADEYAQWKPQDQVKLHVTKGGAVVGIQRVAP